MKWVIAKIETIEFETNRALPIEELLSKYEVDGFRLEGIVVSVNGEYTQCRFEKNSKS